MLNDLCNIEFVKGASTTALDDAEAIKEAFPNTFGRPIVEGKRGAARKCSPKRVGVVFSGGPASGGHNVIAGLFDGLKNLAPESRLFGFLGGPNGILKNKQIEITAGMLASYRDQGGFDLLGTGRAKIETPEQLQASMVTCQPLDGLVIIGGDDSNTNAAVLAEYFLKEGCKTVVVGVPKTIDGDLQNEHLAISFGFDTASKVYSEMIGNLARDCLSTKKYYHFVKLMGRSASHITLECALATHPNYTLISEEKKPLEQITKELADLVVKRAEAGKNFGVVLIPEGLLDHLPFETLPDAIQKQLKAHLDPHGNVNLSIIETERLLMELVLAELKKQKWGGEFSPLNHFYGYEGRSAFPTTFDANYCYALGSVTALLVDKGLTGYMSCIKNLTATWTMAGLPLTMFMNLEERKGKQKPVIRKALVDLHGKPFLQLKNHAASWALNDDYKYPGPIQFSGETRPPTLAVR